MLIGCCHCEQPSESIPSESTPSEPSVSESQSQSVSESQSVSQSSQSVSESIPPGPCGACDLTNGYRPTTLQIEWSLTEYEPDRYFDVWPDTGNCYDQYTGPFTVYSDRGDGYENVNSFNGSVLPTGSVECYYGSIEKPLKSIDCTAVADSGSPSANCRAYAYFVKVATAQYRIYVLIYWLNYDFPTTSSLAQGGIWYWSDELVTLNCFSTYNLEFLRMHTPITDDDMSFCPGPGFNYLYEDTSPTLTNSFPATITITAL